MSVLCEYAIAAYFAYCRIFRILFAYFFPHRLTFSAAILILFVFCYLFLLGFVTSTIRLATDWHHPFVRISVERHGVDGFQQFCAIFPHLSAAYLVFIESVYFLKSRIKLTRLIKWVPGSFTGMDLCDVIILNVIFR